MCVCVCVCGGGGCCLINIGMEKVRLYTLHEKSNMEQCCDDSATWQRIQEFFNVKDCLKDNYSHVNVDVLYLAILSKEHKMFARSQF